MNDRTLLVHPHDDMLVALVDLPLGTQIAWNGDTLALPEDVPRKHKLAVRAFQPGQPLKMYGITVATATRPIQSGQRLTPQNIVHATDPPLLRKTARIWQPPDTSLWLQARFLGYPREDSRFGTRNYWLVMPLVFCENRNVRVMREAMLSALGYGPGNKYVEQMDRLVRRYHDGADVDAILQGENGIASTQPAGGNHVFPHVDGVKFLTHHEGCGGAYADAQGLCGLLAGYVNHPNVAGATVLSLGCQKSQIADLQSEIHNRNPNFSKPLYIFEQQQLGSEETLISRAIRHTFAGLMAANKLRREPAPLAQLTMGVECGGSDGFSGITANPAFGHCSDMLVALGGAVILSEFPELAGCESELAGRCTRTEIAQRFLQIMSSYETQLKAQGNSFDTNPSPGNIRDGLTTDAIKSAGAARKGGSSPVVDVLDYPEPVTRQGLNLLCTPGGDVESTTAMAGSGANVMLFSTGLGTPTGNVITPVIKVSSNSELAGRMSDIIDEDAGTVVSQAESIEDVAARLLNRVVATASGDYRTKAELLGQDDFIPWRRALSM